MSGTHARISTRPSFCSGFLQRTPSCHMLWAERRRRSKQPSMQKMNRNNRHVETASHDMDNSENVKGDMYEEMLAVRPVRVQRRGRRTTMSPAAAGLWFKGASTLGGSCRGCRTCRKSLLSQRRPIPHDFAELADWTGPVLFYMDLENRSELCGEAPSHFVWILKGISRVTVARAPLSESPPVTGRPPADPMHGGDVSRGLFLSSAFHGREMCAFPHTFIQIHTKYDRTCGNLCGPRMGRQ
jgi:hypothetical protein